jgi:hypothetical protein
MSSILHVVAAGFRRLNRHVDWHRLPFWLAIANLAALRIDLRRFNLFDTGTWPALEPVPATGDARGCRTADGSFNDQGAPAMGRAGTRFGRNVPIAETYGETEPALLDPDPRLISRKLLARREFVPARSLNLLAAGWVQFMLHDWFDHGPNDGANPIRVPLDDGDEWPERPMIVSRTGPDPTRTAAEQAQPATFLNTETHWWDASQIYGSSAVRQELVRRDPSTGRPVPDGKLYLEAGHLPLDRDGIELAGMNRNWWVGLSIMHSLFAREHNAICDRLRLEHPDKDGEWLFQKARLINAALLAKIHTVEWTPAMLDTPELRFGMRGNWWGALGEDYFLANGRLRGVFATTGARTRGWASCTRGRTMLRPRGVPREFVIQAEATPEVEGAYAQCPLSSLNASATRSTILSNSTPVSSRALSGA